jgi:hypothetical protein
MVKNGVVRRSIITIDLSKLSYEGKVFLLITNAPNNGKAKTRSPQKNKNVITVSEIIETIDILAIALISDLNSVRTLVNEIKKLPSVQRVEIACINNTVFPISPSYGNLMSQRCLELARDSSEN